MQNDYFNKLQGASSLFMKSDHDGDNDAHSRKMPLGIKSVAQGIEAFADWQGVSDILEQENLSSFEDSQFSKITFSQSDIYASIRRNPEEGVTHIVPENTYGVAPERSRSFVDEWSVNKIKILDDMAFVASDEYTDLHRADIDIADGKLYQHLTSSYILSGYSSFLLSNLVGTLALETTALPLFDTANAMDIEDSLSTTKGEVGTSLDFASYHNCLLRVEFSKSGNFGKRVGYFVYGGALGNDFEDFNTPLNNTELEYSDSVSPSDYLTSVDSNPTLASESVMGKFFLVVDKYEDNFYDSDVARAAKIKKRTGKVGIQLSLQASNLNMGSDKWQKKFGPIAPDGLALYRQEIKTESISLIKIQPVRKCGKIDIYTKKRSIISSIVNNVVTSSGHDLNTNDIIEISSALFDGAQNGVADVHPMNGIKYVKVLDEDTFEIYDDKFLKDHTSSANLRTTDGVTWKCVANNFGTNGQSWDYYGTMFSPTGRNGYKFVDFASSSALSPRSHFITTQRPSKIDSPEHNNRSDEGMVLEFDLPYNELINSYFGRDIDRHIPRSFGVHSSNLDTPLNDPKRGFWDFYPYDEASSTMGARFGCDLDIKFSHMSGGSRVYTLAVGERGADYSVDLFGVYDQTDTYAPPTAIARGNKVYDIFRRKVVPYSLPHGKAHILKITVDQYNRISDISHANTIFGGGKSLVDSSTFDYAREENPWEYSNRTQFRQDYELKCLYGRGAGRTVTLGSSFDENQNNTTPAYDSSYWVRAAVVHWFAPIIHDYKVKNYAQRSTQYIRRGPSGTRKNTPVKADNVNNRSRFGSVGFGGDFTPYQRIDRHGAVLSRYNPYSNYFFFPWVDSFGKSVALKSTTGLTSMGGFADSDPKTVLVSASTCRSNIEKDARDFNLALVDSTKLTEADTISQIGQLQANFLYGDSYLNMDFMHLNAAGADCDRSFQNMNTKYSKRALKDGSVAGYGYYEVMASCSLSAMSVEWVGDNLIWADQELYSAKSVVHGLIFNDGFEKDFTITKNFIDPRDPVPSLSLPSALNTGDGFGVDFRYEKDLFITNSRSKTNETGAVIADYFSDRDRADYVRVYERFRGGFIESQKISSTINKLDEEKYSLSLLNYSNRLLNIPGSVNYDNSTVNSLTWDIDFAGRYDLINGKILIKDPMEYSLFSRNYSVSEQVLSSSIEQEQAQAYLAVVEKTKISNKRSTSSLSYNYISADTTEYSCRDVGGPDSAFIFNEVPLFFFNVPISNLDNVQDLTINFDIINEDIFSYFDLKGNINLADQTDNIIPRLVLYGRDPRTTIIQNGPADNGSSNAFPKYDGGIWSETESVTDQGQYYSHQFPGWYRGGAQDMFFYGRIPGDNVRTGSVSIPSNPRSYLCGGEKNLGEFYDLTAGSRLSGGAGEPAWAAPDVFQDIDYRNIVPYAEIFLPVADQDGYSVTIPAETLKNYIIKGDLTKDTERSTSVVSGFNDTANRLSEDSVDYTVVIGFLLTNIESFDLKTSTITYEEPSSEFSVGALRYILKQEEDNDYVNARYPYAHAMNFYNSSFDGMEYNGTRLEYELRSTIKSLTASVSKSVNSQPRYTNKFHKAAVFDYGQEAGSEVSESYTFRNPTTGQLIKTPVVSDRYIAIPNSRESEYQSSTSSLKFLPNPIISIGKTSTAFPFKDDHEILSTEVVSSLQYNTSYYIDPESGDIVYSTPPTGAIIGTTGFNQATMLGGFDIDRDRFLSLTINSNPSEKDGIDLNILPHGVSSGVITLNTKASRGSKKDMSLYTGIRSRKSNMPAFINAPYNRPMSLFTYEVQPSGSASLLMNAPDSDGSMSLTMSTPKTGVIPLNISGPLPFYNSIPLARVPEFSGVMTGYIDGLGVSNSDMSMVVDSVSGIKGSMSLAFSPGVSGDISLFLARNYEASGSTTLAMPNVFGVATGTIPLAMRNTDKKDSTLFIKPQRYNNEDASLYVNSQEIISSDMNSYIAGPTSKNSNVKTYIRSIFPSGEMELVMKPIDRTLNSGIPLHIANVQYTIPLHINQFENTPIMTMRIDGESLVYNQDTNLFLRNETSNRNVDLFMGSIGDQIQDVSFVVQGSLNSGAAGSAPMFIGKEINADNNASLFISNDRYAVSAGASGLISFAGMAISGGLNYNYTDNSSLYMQAPPYNSGLSSMEMMIKTTEPVLSENGNIIESGGVRTVISGNNDAGAWFKNSNKSSLYIVNRDIYSDGTTLLIDRPEEEIASLFIGSFTESGDINVYISGATLGSGVMDLFIVPPYTVESELFIRGYLE